MSKNPFEQFNDIAETDEAWVCYVKHNDINVDSAIAHGALLCLAKVKWSASRRFCFDDSGMASAVLTVTQNGAIEDLIAWPSRAGLENKFAPHRNAVALLGIDEAVSWDGDRPLFVWRNPLRWLQHRCRGIVLIDEARAALWIPAALGGRIIAEDQAHAHELSRVLHRRVDTPVSASTIEWRAAA